MRQSASSGVNEICAEILELQNDFHMKDFLNSFAEKLLSYNSSYLEYKLLERTLKEDESCLLAVEHRSG